MPESSSSWRRLRARRGSDRSTMALARTLSSLGRAALASPRLVRTASLGLDRAFSSTSSSASSTTSTSSSELGTQAEVRRHVEGLIKFRGGPITFAEYMKTSLGSPVGGYYGDKYVGKEGERAPVIGARGDFVTSPEISQLFGEMVGVWCLTVWQQLGSPDTLRLVELGPGKGTLMADLLRSTGSPSPIFHSFQSALYNGEKAGVSLVEISPAFREAQADKLSKFQKDGKGLNLEWHSALSDVPRDNTPTIYIAHEFLDALPVHMFVKKGAGWTELLVNLEDAQPVSLDPNAKPPEPQFVNMLSPGETPAMKMLLKPKLDTLGDATRAEIREVEVSASAIEHALDLGERLVSSKGGGAALFMDYGYEELPGRFTCRAIRDHKVLDDLLASGADITADVDFGALKWAVENYQWGEKAPKVFGAVTQAQFLLSCGIGHRVQALLESPGISEKQAQELVQGYTRLVGGSADEGMGEVYKAMALVSTPESTEPGVPVGF
ncbi:S-adenosyl-L-methionine-dependent methyltransferase [Chloropicon primus]|nr:S-adenosyl-L-methionine-dependent methyltransferase [Chloropicon primus]